MFKRNRHINYFQNGTILKNKTIRIFTIIILSFCHTIVFSQDYEKTKGILADSKIGYSIGSSGMQLTYITSLKKQPKISFKTGIFFLNFRQTLNLNLEENSSLKFKPNFLSYGLSMQAEKELKDWLHIYVVSRAFFEQKWHLNLSTPNGIDLNGLQLETEDFGQIDATLQWWRIQPGIGLRLGKENPLKRFNISASVATFYMGSPKINLNYEGFLETTTLQDALPQLEHNMRNYSFYPAINFNLTYNLIKTQE